MRKLDLGKLKKQNLRPSAGLWLRIEDTLARRHSPWRIVVHWMSSTVFAAACALLIFTGNNYYESYQLEQYLLNSFAPAYYSEVLNFGTFI